MTKIRLTKRFNFEMAHALLDYDGLCSNIHGHSYVLWVTVCGAPNNDAKSPKRGMVIDFSQLNKMIKEEVIAHFDHALLLNKDTNKEIIQKLSTCTQKIMQVNYQPTSENLLLDFVERIKPMLPKSVALHSLKLQETETSFAEWFAADND